MDDVKLDKYKANPMENLLPEDGLYICLYKPGEQYGDQKDSRISFSGVKILIGQVKLQKNQLNLTSIFSYKDKICPSVLIRELRVTENYGMSYAARAYVHGELHIPENIQATPWWVNKWNKAQCVNCA